MINKSVVFHKLPFCSLIWANEYLNRGFLWLILNRIAPVP